MDNLNGLSDSKHITADIPALRLLSRNLESIFESHDFDFYSDAKILLSSGREVSVHRCILSARSPFFKNVFCGKQNVAKFEVKELVRDYDVNVDSLVAAFVYWETEGVAERCLCLC